MTNNEFALQYTENAEDDLYSLINDKGKKAVRKAVVKSLKLMGSNLKHPSLNTHKYDEMEGPNGKKFSSLMLKITPLGLIVFFGIMALKRK